MLLVVFKSGGHHSKLLSRCHSSSIPLDQCEKVIRFILEIFSNTKPNSGARKIQLRAKTAVVGKPSVLLPNQKPSKISAMPSSLDP